MKSLPTLLALLAFGTVSFAADDAHPKKEGDKPKHAPAERFKKLDANNDGSVTADEFKASPKGQKDPAKADEIFKKKDKDGDGKLSLDELKAHCPKREKKNKK